VVKQPHATHIDHEDLRRAVHGWRQPKD
jgi:hypothetical protein